MREYVEIKLNEPPLLINQSSKKIRDKSRKKKQKRTEIRLPLCNYCVPEFRRNCSDKVICLFKLAREWRETAADFRRICAEVKANGARSRRRVYQATERKNKL